MINISREIPIRVDQAPVSLARAETAASTFNLNVANPRENTINAVTIVPSARGIVFSPDEYYIGTMDPDEVFTISFGIQSDDAAKKLTCPANLSFTARFKTEITGIPRQPTSAAIPAPGWQRTGQLSSSSGVAASAVLIAGGYMYRRRMLANGKAP